MSRAPSCLLSAALALSLVACGGGGGNPGGAGGGGTGATAGAGGTGGTGGGDAGVPDSGAPDAAVVPCGSGSATALAGCVEQARYEADLAAMAVPRPPQSTAWQAVQDRCAERFAAHGFQVERQSYGTGVNVIGTLAGSDPTAGSVLLSAHYDGLPGCDAADDNASGVAALLEGARVLAQGKYRRTLVVACWDQEEEGLIGSQAYVARAKADGAVIQAAFVLETIGYRSEAPGSQTLPPGFSLLFPQQTAVVQANESRGDFVAVIGDTSIAAPAAAFSTAAAALGLPAISLTLDASQKNSDLFLDLRRSDHAAFWVADYPALMLTDTANFRNSHYHCEGGEDAVGDLDPAFTVAIVKATVAAVGETLELQ